MSESSNPDSIIVKAGIAAALDRNTDEQNNTDVIDLSSE